MKRLITILSIILFSGSYASVFSANFSSIANGDWSTNSTWGGSSNPGSSTADDITINNSVTSSISITIKNHGILTIKSGATLTVSSNLQFDNGSVILIEAGGKLIVNSLTNNNNSNNVTVNGTITVSGAFTNGNGGALSGSGNITAGSFSGAGSTFGHTPTTGIPSNSTVSNGGLPVELISFDYTLANGQVELHWATSSETNNDFFTVERSTDGVSYEIIATIGGSGNSNSILTYHYNDENPIAGTSYYRLKQTDFDGKFEYVATVACKFNSGDLKTFSIINTVITDNISINLSGVTGKYTIAIFSYSGQKVYESNYTFNNSYTNLYIPFNAEKGYYILSILSSDGTSSSFKLLNE
jgi:VCBS repeat-containing protein